jgi:hypothetical protein
MTRSGTTGLACALSPGIERLIIKDCVFRKYGGRVKSEVYQEYLVQMVRNHPSLRWLRSNLSAEHVAMHDDSTRTSRNYHCE